MPARGAPKPPAPPPDKDVWLAACVDELGQLRPHLRTYGNKVARAIALQLWAARPDTPPAEAARAWHKANPA